ncbi:MAG TPA: hypothetical protein VGW58_08400 [Pyrinomonadaceae bacterium]|nr:hypothetical protein [Pyrinomonadaceae bacterium]
MSRTLLVMFCLAVGLMVLACGNPTNRNAATTTTASAPAASPAASAAATVTASADQIGVPECDSFLTAYENCVKTKVPEASRAQFQTGMNTWRTEWKKLAANPQTKAGLVSACKTHLANARTQMKAYNCTF